VFMPSNPRSTRAVVVGLVIVLALTIAGYFAARGLGLIVPGTIPPERDLFLFNLCFMMFMMIGGYATAKLAPFDPRNHTISLGVILTVLGLIGSIAQSLAHYGPNWFGWLLVLSGLPFAWLGGKIKRD
jgi:hypothetical protein